jgi:hypothetical protein
VWWAEQGRAAPASFTATFDGPFALTLEVAFQDGRPICERLEASRLQGGAPLTNALARFPIRDLMLEAASQVLNEAGNELTMDALLAGPSPSRSGIDEVLRHMRAGERRAKSHSELLKRVVTTYRRFIEAGDQAPRTATAKELQLKATYVGRLLHEARRTKPPLLGPAEPGRAGEAKRRARTNATKTTKRRTK